MKRPGPNARRRAVGKPVSVAGNPHLLVKSQAAIGGVQERVFLRAIHRHLVIAAHAVIQKFDDDFLPNPLYIPVPPIFERIGGSRPSSLLHRPLICATRGMRLNLIRRPVDYIDSAAVAFPAGDTGGEVLVGVGDAPVILLFRLAFYGVKGGGTP